MPKDTRSADEARGARTRRRVLEAAISVVTERPLADVQLQHIAERAGISAGHVLYHFGSKERILIATLEWSEGEIAARRARELGEIDDPVLRLRKWIVLFLPHTAGDPTWKLWLEVWLRLSSDERLRRIPGSISDSWMDDLHAILDDGVARGSFRAFDWRTFWPWAHSLLVGLSIGVLVGWVDLDGGRHLAEEWIGGALRRRGEGETDPATLNGPAAMDPFARRGRRGPRSRSGEC
jgi:AcrR family transcriptional regulator